MAKAQRKNTVIQTIASSNSWLIGMLLLLMGVVVVTFYNYSTFRDVKGVSTRSAELRPSISPSNRQNDDRLSNGCFVLKGNLAVLDTCGKGLYKHVEYQCGDGTKIRLGDTTSCKSIANWLSTVAFSCKNHTSCDAKITPTPRITDRPEISRRPTPTVHSTPTPTIHTTNQ